MCLSLQPFDYAMGFVENNFFCCLLNKSGSFEDLPLNKKASTALCNLSHTLSEQRVSRLELIAFLGRISRPGHAWAGHFCHRLPQRRKNECT